MDSKLDKVLERIENIDKTLIRQEGHLEEHMRRTKHLEERMKPVENHVIAINAGLKLAIIVGGALVGMATILKLFIH